MFKILIIVPTKDSWLQLPSLINSLEQQSDENFRVIFVDYNSCEKHYKYLNDVCNANEKYKYVIQHEDTGIFGAMNEGLNYLEDNEWVLFWGSDDFASSKNTISELRNCINKKIYKDIDMLIFKGNFFDHNSQMVSSKNHFSKIVNAKFDAMKYRNMLFKGFRQAHQATLINPNKNLKKHRYKTSILLASDLNYFLESTHYKKLKILSINIPLVNIGNEGISGKKHFLRTYEVLNIYWKEFKIFFFIPFLLRYWRN